MTLKNNVQKEITKWLEEVIIGLNLCPFAKAPFEQDLIRISSSNETSEEEQVKFFLDELDLLQKTPSKDLSTSLIVFESFKGNFLDFNDFSGLLEDLLLQLKLEEDFQLVAFHPEFYFNGLKPDDKANLVNRSPYPLIHLLRSEEIAQVTTSETMGETISYNNEKTLNNLTDEQLKKLYPKQFS